MKRKFSLPLFGLFLAALLFLGIASTAEVLADSPIVSTSSWCSSDGTPIVSLQAVNTFSGPIWTGMGAGDFFPMIVGYDGPSSIYGGYVFPGYASSIWGTPKTVFLSRNMNYWFDLFEGDYNTGPGRVITYTDGWTPACGSSITQTAPATITLGEVITYELETAHQFRLPYMSVETTVPENMDFIGIGTITPPNSRCARGAAGGYDSKTRILRVGTGTGICAGDSLKVTYMLKPKTAGTSVITACISPSKSQCVNTTTTVVDTEPICDLPLNTTWQDALAVTNGGVYTTSLPGQLGLDGVWYSLVLTRTSDLSILVEDLSGGASGDIAFYDRQGLPVSRLSTTSTDDAALLWPGLPKGEYWVKVSQHNPEICPRVRVTIGWVNWRATFLPLIQR
ncbi:MAG: hypothetical protein WCV93_04485 [Candidatus Shapirobacteria bacterium]|jgi:hypothetical protein